MPGRRLLVTAIVGASLLAAAGSPAAAVYHDRVHGTEVPPISSTRGTFVGIATGQLPGGWRVQIKHRPLASAATIAITGGSFSLRTPNGQRLGGPVTGGWVAVLDHGDGCHNQIYRVVARLSVGHFTGTLVHHRHSILGHCLIYAATINGHTTLSG